MNSDGDKAVSQRMWTEACDLSKKYRAPRKLSLECILDVIVSERQNPQILAHTHSNVLCPLDSKEFTFYQ